MLGKELEGDSELVLDSRAVVSQNGSFAMRIIMWCITDQNKFCQIILRNLETLSHLKNGCDNTACLYNAR